MKTAIFIELTDYASREKLVIDGNLQLLNQLLKSIQEPSFNAENNLKSTSNENISDQVADSTN